ncbi:CheY chemotaxis protein or a CheY-like REC (receiver) domain [Faunimonas pinastri]|uniref:CheY chemotaxis protein or a CheY-like REC (Receiver) domain n=2 Tax=Faunimonas pinastri TaxID=1855383 RepID=A0A1H9ILV9_9HYPH|nr:CheY chemotaxis protein or a CheY-like REC (receiver) domain [Faunimonas pinastri]
MLVAMLIEEMLIDLGYVVVGMAMRLEQGLAAARVVDADVAILDVNLDGKESFPIAEVLKSRNLPFFFATGYGSKGLNPAFEGTLTLNKPFQTDELKAAFEAVCP